MAQVVSYEVVMLTLVVIPVLLLRGFGGVDLHIFKEGGVSLAVVLWPVFITWCLCVCAEANRAPFDFAEGESELVSGFNVEYRGGGFALIFLGEYLALVYLCFFSCCLFLGRVREGLVRGGVVAVQGCFLACFSV